MVSNASPLDDDNSWRHDALCAKLIKESKDLQNHWYSEENTFQAATATSICFACPVRKECLREACANRESYGIWGGLPVSVRTTKGRVHNFLRLLDLLDPYNTEDENSPFHIQNLGEGDSNE